MRKTKALLIALSLLLLLAGCSNRGSEYLGKWQSTQGDKAQIEIVRNGDNFLVALSGNPQKLPAVLKDGALQVPGSGATVTYVKDTGKLIVQVPFGGTDELSRIR